MPARPAPASSVQREQRELADLQLVVRARNGDTEALDALIRRTRRYAAYQRKWMRRIPDLVPLDATRPADVVAEELIQLASRRAAGAMRA
jgi:tRNA A37 N6-isopentenylltransferase MiaA